MAKGRRKRKNSYSRLLVGKKRQLPTNAEEVEEPIVSLLLGRKGGKKRGGGILRFLAATFME